MLLVYSYEGLMFRLADYKYKHQSQCISLSVEEFPLSHSCLQQGLVPVKISLFVFQICGLLDQALECSEIHCWFY